MKQEKILLICDRIMASAYYALIYFLPISIALIETCLGIAQVTYFVKRGFVFYSRLRERENIHLNIFRKFLLFIKSFLPVSSCLSKSLGVFILLSFLSIFFSQAPALSVKVFFTKLLKTTFVYFIFIECMNNPKRLKNFLLAAGCSVLLVTVNGFYQFFAGHDFIKGKMLGDGSRVSSCFSHPNDFGPYLIIVGLFLMTLIMGYWLPKITNGFLKDEPKLTRRIFSYPAQWFIHCLFAAVFICLGLTFSRGVWLGWLSALFFIGVLRRERFWFPFVLGVVFLAAFYPQMLSGRQVSFISDDVNFQEVADNGTLIAFKDISVLWESKDWYQDLRTGHIRFPGLGRVSFWAYAFDIIRAFPVFGVGIGAYPKVAPYYGLNDASPHNGYLKIAGEIGIPGLFVFFWIIFSFMKNSLRHWKSQKDRLAQALVLRGTCGLVGFFVQTIFDTNLESVPLVILMWMTFGLVISAQKIFFKPA